MSRLLDGLSDPTVILDRSLRVVFANAEARMRFAKASLCDGQEFGTFLCAAFPASDFQHVLDSLRAVADAGSDKAATVIVRDDAHEVHLRIVAMEGGVGDERAGHEPWLAISFFEPEAGAYLRRLEFVLDSSPDGIFLLDRDTRIVYFNDACEKMTGWTRASVLMQTFDCASVLRCHNEAGQSLRAMGVCPAKMIFHLDSVPTTHEMLITTSGGRERWVETNYSPIRDPTGEIEFIVGIIRDIDERKRLESQLVQSRNLASLGQLVSGIAHEIKNPLGIIMSSVEIVLNEDRPVDQRREAAGFIKDEVRRLDDRVKAFLAFARPKPMLPDEINVNDVLAGVVLGYSSLGNSRFRIDQQLGADVPATIADPDLLHQVFLNLVLNADQAMPDGGTLTIRTQRADEEHVRILFIDEGTGIKPENLPSIFDPFFTTRKEGTGLGLSIVHQILTSHRGRISVTNHPGGRGVTFEILLPVARIQRLNP